MYRDEQESYEASNRRIIDEEEYVGISPTGRFLDELVGNVIFLVCRELFENGCIADEENLIEFANTVLDSDDHPADIKNLAGAMVSAVQLQKSLSNGNAEEAALHMLGISLSTIFPAARKLTEKNQNLMDDLIYAKSETQSMIDDQHKKMENARATKKSINKKSNEIRDREMTHKIKDIFTKNPNHTTNSAAKIIAETFSISIRSANDKVKIVRSGKDL